MHLSLVMNTSRVNHSKTLAQSIFSYMYQIAEPSVNGPVNGLFDHPPKPESGRHGAYAVPLARVWRTLPKLSSVFCEASIVIPPLLGLGKIVLYPSQAPFVTAMMGAT